MININTKTYIGVKEVKAQPMNRQEYNDLKGWTIPLDEEPTDAGFLVIYPDGYTSWSPEKVFNEAYRELSGLTFGYAVEAMKAGKKVSRSGWNGKGMFLYYVCEGAYPAKMEAIQGLFENNLVPYRPYIALRTAQGDVVPWCSTQSDILAEDFFVVE